MTNTETATEQTACAFPDCERPVETYSGKGRRPTYCDLPEHTPKAAFLRRRAEAGEMVPEIADRPVTMGLTRAGELVSVLTSQMAGLAEALPALISELRELDPGAAELEVSAVQADARRDVAAAEQRASEEARLCREAREGQIDAQYDRAVAEDAAAQAIAEAEAAQERAQRAEELAAAAERDKNEAVRKVQAAQEESARTVQAAQAQAQERIQAVEDECDEKVAAVTAQAEQRVQAAQTQRDQAVEKEQAATLLAGVAQAHRESAERERDQMRRDFTERIAELHEQLKASEARAAEARVVAAEKTPQPPATTPRRTKRATE